MRLGNSANKENVSVFSREYMQKKKIGPQKVFRMTKAPDIIFDCPMPVVRPTKAARHSICDSVV